MATPDRLTTHDTQPQMTPYSTFPSLVRRQLMTDYTLRPKHDSPADSCRRLGEATGPFLILAAEDPFNLEEARRALALIAATAQRAADDLLADTRWNALR